MGTNFIFRPVGREQTNLKQDVKIVQALLSGKHASFPGMPRLSQDGRCGAITLRAIRIFQASMTPPQTDGVISPNGPTFKALVAGKVSAATSGSENWGDVDYLARTLYGESRGEAKASKTAVAWVIRNRLKSGRWGSSYRSVVTARWQFTSWMQSVDPGNYAAIQNPHGAAWDECLDVAKTVIAADDKTNPVPDATHYYSPNAQAALHKVNSSLYPEVPAWAASPAVLLPNPLDVPSTSFQFYKNVR